MTRIKPTVSKSGNEPAQAEAFKALARELEADEDEGRWDERLAKVARHKPAPEPEQPE